MSDPNAETSELRILIVDDDPVVSTLSAQALSDVGFTVEVVDNGREALASIDRLPPELVLLDVEMPGLDGFETCIAIRARDTAREIPVLMATGHTDPATIERAFDVGATDFISKPFDWQILQHRVRFLMRASTAFADLSQTLTHLRASEERLANAQRIARLGHWEWVPGDEEMLWSNEVFRIFGIELGPGASSYEAFLRVVHPDDRVAVEKAMQSAVSESAAWELDHRIFSASGAERVVHQQVEVVQSGDGRPERIAGTIQDITERRRAEQQIRFFAYYDSLTGLPNRRRLKEYLAANIEEARARNAPLALAILNLDRFKRINDTLGHDKGDDLLRAVAKRLMSCLRSTDFVNSPESASVSRLGGDEFTVVLNEVRSAEDAAQVSRRILEALREPFVLNDQELVMSASIGVAIFPSDGDDVDTLLSNANTAMHHAKSEGREGYRFFSESMNESAVRNLRLESGLRTAIDRDELVLHYQPQREMTTGAMTAAEALVRWQSPEHGLVSPGEFIPLAEETGLIGAVGEWVLRTACAQTRAWRDAGLPIERIAVNVSSYQLRRPGLADLVDHALQEIGLDPTHLELEITESALIGIDQGVVGTLARIKDLGVRIALDDFGTGYSSLSHLVRFPIDTLKIDRSFVAALESDDQARGIIAAVIAMAHRLHLDVTAEGVETEAQEDFLRSEGCDAIQGYLACRPVEPVRFEGVLRGTEDGTIP
jgi:diguanylate cyclase (GGDEF)-like protein/PAS domain S-box-containing protein